jgi:hypothetical protein
MWDVLVGIIVILVLLIILSVVIWYFFIRPTPPEVITGGVVSFCTNDNNCLSPDKCVDHVCVKN